MPGMQIELDDVSSADVQDLLRFHVNDMRGNSPPGTAHALDWTALQQPHISFWTAREHGQLMACGALQQLDASTVEIKSMRTHPDFLRRGVASALLDHLIATARNRGCDRIYLETGSTTPFIPALTLYESRGFCRCEPFADYTDTGFNVFMYLDLTTAGPA